MTRAPKLEVCLESAGWWSTVYHVTKDDGN